ncbi:unnamed protein product [Allacma fusca]|uniref:Uncharacterized protein n=1 Tax=Allacma fusca TaxID=39272 RepID=A0A8J2PBJ1_9HEXA|nr:unnamed protein product [Allacma fusca]
MDPWDTEEVVIPFEERQALKKRANCLRSAARRKRKLHTMAEEVRGAKRDSKMERQKQNLMAKTDAETKRIFVGCATQHFWPCKRNLPQTATTSRMAKQPNAPTEEPPGNTFVVHTAWTAKVFEFVQGESKFLQKDSLSHKAMMVLRALEQKKRAQTRRVALQNDFFNRY